MKLIFLILLPFLYIYGENISSIKKKATITYQKAYECFKLNENMLSDKIQSNNWTFPDDAIDHYNHLLSITRKYRYLRYIQPLLFYQISFHFT